MEWTVLGIDPGTVRAGWGLIQAKSDGSLKCLDYGLIQTDGRQDFAVRLKVIHKGLVELLRKHKPDHLAVEKMFLSRNPDVAFKLGHIFALCLLESEKRDIKFFEYASRLVKKTVTFSGNASKELVQRFVVNFFSLPKPPSALDSTDALAVALCHIRAQAGLSAFSARQTSSENQPAGQIRF